jgi:transcriptional regulator with XRE-family HTH domain
MIETSIYPANIDNSSRIESAENKLGFTATTILLSTVLIAGTGSVCAIRNVESNNGFFGRPIITVIDRNLDSRSGHIAQKQLLRIRSAFGLNMSELARVLGVSRPALYSWIQGVEPRPDAIARIWALDEHAKTIASLKIPRVSSLLRRPILDGKNLLDLLTANQFVAEGIANIQQVIETDRPERSRIRAKRTGRPRLHRVEDVSNVLS